MATPVPSALPFEPAPIRWSNLWWAAAAIAAIIATIAWGNLWALNFLHIGAGLLWTGIDLFMGFVVGPALRRTPFEVRRAVMTQLTPRTMFLLPGAGDRHRNDRVVGYDCREWSMSKKLAITAAHPYRRL